ncbi:MAG: hypothetical protein K1X47_04935 [Cyclobacteriaceae bacterium]|nr:hypothetical protein [Cyclobacteriaceae bacterium]
MKTILLAVVLLGAGFASLGQQDSTLTPRKPNRFLALTIGGAVPVGQFGQSTSSLQGSGFGRPGFLYGAEYASFWSQHVGFGLKAGHFSNAVNEMAFKRDQQTNWASTFITAPNTIISSAYSDIKPWRSTYLLAGPYLTQRWGNFSLDFKFLGGVMYTKYPAMQMDFVSQPAPFQPYETTKINTAPDNNAGFAFNIGLGGRIHGKRNSDFFFAIDYIRSNTKSTYVLAYGGGSFGSTSVDAGSYSLGLLNVSWGVAFGNSRKH